MARKLKNMENEKHAMQDLKFGWKHRKTGKMRNTHFRTWNMARNTENGGK